MSVTKYTQMVLQHQLRRSLGGGNNWNTGPVGRTRSGSGTPSRSQHRIASVSGVSNLRENTLRSQQTNNRKTRINRTGAWLGTSTASMRTASEVVGSTGRPRSNRNGSVKAMSTSTRGSKIQLEDIKSMSKNQQEKIASMIHGRLREEKLKARQKNGETSLRQQFGRQTSANSGNTRKSAENALKQRLQELTSAQVRELLRQTRPK